MKWNADMVAIEVTRRCNMVCEHCLRGNAQNKNQTKENIDKLMSQMGYISSITFTGGEPSLVPELIAYTLESAKRYSVGVGSFYIATNGKQITEDFVVACLRWYVYCADNECTGVVLSKDDYHDGDISFDLLRGLSFFSVKEGRSIISEGRAKGWAQGRKWSKESFIINNDGTCTDINEGIIYLNCNGDIIGGCDWSYRSQPKHKICDVSKLTIEAFKTFGAVIDTGD